MCSFEGAGRVWLARPGFGHRFGGWLLGYLEEDGALGDAGFFAGGLDGGWEVGEA